MTLSLDHVATNFLSGAGANCGCVIIMCLKEPPLFHSHLLQFQFTSTPLCKMIQVGTFRAPHVDREHLVEAVGTGACI